MDAILAPLLDAALKGSVLIVLAAVLVRLLRRRSAATRHAVWAVALLAQLALPVLSFALPTWTLPLLPRIDRPLAALRSASVPEHLTPSASVLPASPKPRTRYASDAVVLRTIPSTETVLRVLWLAGFLVMLARLGLGTAAVARLARQAERVDDGPWLSLMQRLAATLRIRRPVTLLRGNQLAVPVTWGVVYPAVLLPRAADNWPAARRQFVLVHELAHVKRFDALTQLTSQLALVIFWMNPLVWVAERQMRLERERACDDYVLREGTVASTYANELLEIVRTLHSATGPTLAALAFVRRSDLEIRMLAILDPRVSRRAFDRRGAVVTGALAALVVVPLAVLRPVARESSGREGPAAPALIQQLSQSPQSWSPPLPPPPTRTDSPATSCSDSTISRSAFLTGLWSNGHCTGAVRAEGRVAFTEKGLASLSRRVIHARGAGQGGAGHQVEIRMDTARHVTLTLLVGGFARSSDDKARLAVTLTSIIESMRQRELEQAQQELDRALQEALLKELAQTWPITQALLQHGTLEQAPQQAEDF